MKPLKKLTALAIMLLLGLSCAFVPASAAAVGEAYYSFTYAFINESPIPLYTYNNYPFILAEDLKGYGFDEVWDPSTETLYLNYNTAKARTPYDRVSVGNDKAYDIYPSSVSVVLDGSPTETYSVGGMALIPFDALGMYGEVVWLPGINATYVTTGNFRAVNPDWRKLLPGHITAFKLLNYSLSSAGAIEQLGEDLQYSVNGIGYYDTIAYPSYSLHYNTRDRIQKERDQLSSDYWTIADLPDFYQKADILKATKETLSIFNGYLSAFDYIASTPLTIDNVYSYPEKVTNMLDVGNYLQQTVQAVINGSTVYLSNHY